jgi:thiamine biosynthesis protein ThiI
MDSVIIVHHHEITLKGGNRKMFERQLMRNTRMALSGVVPASAVWGGYGRFVIGPVPQSELDPAVNCLQTVFGLANICIGLKMEQDVGKFSEAAALLLNGRTFATIKVDTRRADKTFPVGSMEVNARVGEFICKKFGVRANLSQPDETIFIEIADGAAYVYRSKVQGAGGLPVGVSGKVTALLSAGFDSPVASYRMMKRGARVIFVHFHSAPYVTQNSVDQVKQLVEILTKYQFDSKLYVVPFGEAQQEIVAQTPPALRVVLYRRFMVRIAEAIAHREKAQALVTGESLGQVASQTLRNMRVINDVANLPILRPLVGMDKEEIIATGRKIGTYEISEQPYDDCCSFLTPRNPETGADPKVVEEVESKLDISNLVAMCVEKAAVEHFEFAKRKQATLQQGG